MLFLTLMNVLAYIAPSLFFFTIHIAMYAFRSDVLGRLNLLGQVFYDAFVYTIDFIYIMNFLGLVYFSMHLTSRNKKFMPYIYLASTLFGLFSIIIFIVLTFDLIKGLIGDNECKYLFYYSLN